MNNQPKILDKLPEPFNSLAVRRYLTVRVIAGFVIGGLAFWLISVVVK